MVKLIEVADGLRLIRGYLTYTELTESNFQASYNQIWCGKYSGQLMSSDDLKRLTKLGWFEDEGAWSKLI